MVYAKTLIEDMETNILVVVPVNVRPSIREVAEAVTNRTQNFETYKHIKQYLPITILLFKNKKLHLFIMCFLFKACTKVMHSEE